MAARRTYTVKTRKKGLNLREEPSKESNILALLLNGAKVTVDRSIETPNGWLAVKGGGYVMAEFLQ